MTLPILSAHPPSYAPRRSPGQLRRLRNSRPPRLRLRHPAQSLLKGLRTTRTLSRLPLTPNQSPAASGNQAVRRRKARPSQPVGHPPRCRPAHLKREPHAQLQVTPRTPPLPRRRAQHRLRPPPPGSRPTRGKPHGPSIHSTAGTNTLSGRFAPGHCYGRNKSKSSWSKVGSKFFDPPSFGHGLHWTCCARRA